MIRSFYKPPMANISLNSELLQLSFELWTETRMPALTASIYIVLEILTNAICQEEKMA